MSQTSPTRRQPWVALVLSLFCTGLGHTYCGRIVTGLVLFLAFLLFAPAIVLAAFLSPSTTVLIGILLAVLAALGIILFAAGDAYRVARQASETYERREYNQPIVYALFILVGVTYPVGMVSYLRANFFEAFYIPTASEVPNVLPGDHVLVNKVALQFRYPQRGDVIVFHKPGDRQYTYVKRVIGLPGDKVAARGDKVYVNGKPLERDPVPADSLAAIQGLIEGPVYYETNAGRRYMIMLGPVSEPIPAFAERKVPEGTCFVLGDNRNRSLDSRGFGFVPLGDILGLLQYIYCPAETWIRFGAYTD
jgi:signal peptidase I